MMYSRLRWKLINYAVLHTNGQKVAAGSTTTVPVDSDGMDIAALSLAEEASRLADDASREVDRILNLSEEDLEQALKKARDEAAALARRKKVQELVKLLLKKVDQRQSVEVAELTVASVKRQSSMPRMQAESERRLFDHVDLDFNAQLLLKDLEFLDQEVERVVHGQVGARYDPEYSSRPEQQDFDIPAGKRGERSGLRQVLNHNRARTPQLCPQEYLRVEHVRDPIKYDDLDLRLFVSGELNIIDRDDILQREWHGRLNLLKHILYLAGFYEWRGCMQLYPTIINQIELGIKSWSSDFSEEQALVLLPYAQPNRRERPQATEPVRRNQNQNRNSDTPDSRVWFCGPYQKGDCNKPESHRAFVQGGGGSHEAAHLWKMLSHR